MARTGRLNLSIDVDRYRELPADVRVRFDAWLETEGLWEERIVKFGLGEGVIVAERIKVDADGNPVLGKSGEEIVLEHYEYPVRTTPPREAMEDPS